MQTKHTIDNVLSRYKTVLNKYNIINTCARLAVTTMLITGTVASSLIIESAVGAVSVAKAATTADTD